MNRLDKTKSLRLTKADPVRDIDLINQHSLKELSPEDVYAYSINLCDNDVDRDLERFTDATLADLAPMFVGKPGLADHRWSAETQHSRIYRCEVVNGDGTTRMGQPLKHLRASAYMLKNEQTQPMIDAIEGGIIKEVSVGCRTRHCNCSVCGEALSYDWRTGLIKCRNDHAKGETYDGKLCVGDLEQAEDAYEFSFVAVPSQRMAGVTKGAQNLDEAFDLLMAADLTDHQTQIQKLMPQLQKALTTAEERQERAAILKFAEKL